MEDAIFSRKELLNREENRKFDNEIHKLRWNLGWINTNFIQSLFTLPDHVSYDEIYLFHLDQWIEEVKYVNKKLKIARVNEDWFSEQYKPLENK
jgi:hypothetical protein